MQIADKLTQVAEKMQKVYDAGFEAGKAVGGGGESGGNQEDASSLYQRVEYLISDGSQYIVTDFIGDNESGMELIASFPTLVDRVPMGSRTDTGATRFYCVYPLSSSSFYYGFNTGSSISAKPVANTIYRLQTNFMNSRLINVFDVDGTMVGGTSITQTLAKQTMPVSIFGYHAGASSTVTSLRAMTFYGARCSRGNAVVREYIPCYRKSDGVVGVFEAYTEQFFTASGTLEKGPDTEWGDASVTNYDKGYSDGQKAEHDRFWDVFQQHGSRTDYGNKGAGILHRYFWSMDNFYPKYDIMPVDMTNMFYYWTRDQHPNVTDWDLAKRLEDCGVVLDTSGLTDIGGILSYNSFTHIPFLDFSNATVCGTSGPFEYDSYLVTIDGIRMAETTPINRYFVRCGELVDCPFEGVIGQNGLNVSWSTKLSHDSLMSIINALKDGASNTITLGTANLAKLTNAEKAIATQKGWTLA